MASRLEQLRAADGGERRIAERWRLDPPAQVELVVDSRRLPTSAQLVDVSASGVGLRLSTPMPPGREFTLSFPKDVGLDTTLRYRIVRCRPMGHGAFHIGAAFVRTRPQT